MKRRIEVRFNDVLERWDIWYLDTEDWCGAIFPTKGAAELNARQLRKEMKGDGPSELGPKLR